MYVQTQSPYAACKNPPWPQVAALIEATMPGIRAPVQLQKRFNPAAQKDKEVPTPWNCAHWRPGFADVRPTSLVSLASTSSAFSLPCLRPRHISWTSSRTLGLLPLDYLRLVVPGRPPLSGSPSPLGYSNYLLRMQVPMCASEIVSVSPNTPKPQTKICLP